MKGEPAPVPFLDLASVYADLREELDLGWKSVLASAGFVGGPEVERFEAEFAEYCEAQSCVGVANGTDALELTLAALGVGPGDEVIVPANTFVATPEAVCAVGARPRFVDVCPDTLLLDPEAAEAAVNRRTAAVIGVHLFGQMVDVPHLTALAERHGLAFIEDAAQAHGASYAGRRAGGVGTAATFSFYPGKNLGALGDGGAVVTNDADLAARVRQLASHGRSTRDPDRHEMRGRNSRLDSIQAMALSVRLSRLDADNARRRDLVRSYGDQLPEPCRLVGVATHAVPVYHLAVVRCEQRARACRALTAGHVAWRIHYPVPCHLQPAFVKFREQLPVVEQAAEQILSLPAFPTMPEAAVTRVCDVLSEALR